MKLSASLIPFSRPYRSVFSAGIGISMAYRGFFFLQFFFQLFPLVTQLFLWTAVYKGAGANASIAGFDKSGMLTYFLLVNMLSLCGSGGLPWEMAGEIRQGKISQFLVRPFHYAYYQWHLLIGRLAIESLFLVLPAALLLFLTRSVLHVPDEAWRWWAFGLSVVLGTQISFLINFALGTLSFWLLENSSIMYMMGPLQMLFSGSWFPLALLPGPMQLVFKYSPFAYQFYFPVTVYLGQTDGNATLHGLGLQALWALGLSIFCTWLWKKAIRSYSAVGG